MDYFQNVGELGLGSRLKRLSDAFMNEVREVYSAQGYPFEPRWFPLFSLLSQNDSVTVTQAAEALNLTYPHISQLAKEMAKAKLISARKNPADARSRVLALTSRGKELVKEFAPLWADIREAVQSVLREADPAFLDRLGKMERALEEKPFSRRVREAARMRAAKDCRILDYDRKIGRNFEKLNREWIEAHFSIEPHDVKSFSNPEKAIIRAGGDIIFAELDGEIVGTCALIINDGVYELAKLAVTDRARGYGIGELLSEEIIRRARKKGAKRILLTTNSRLVPAVKLYEKLGFRETFRGKHPTYRRVDLVMEKKL